MRISFQTFKLCIKSLTRIFVLFVSAVVNAVEVFIGAVVRAVSTLITTVGIFVDILLPKRVGLYIDSIKSKSGRLSDKELSTVLLKLNNERRILAYDNECRGFTRVIEGTSIPSSESLILFSYKNPYIKRALWDTKYYNKTRFVDFFASVWSDELISLASDRVCLPNFSLDSKSYIVHPPSSSHARGEKGFDQMNVLVEKMIQDYSLDNFYFYLKSFVVQNDFVDGVSHSQHKGTKRQRLEWSRSRYKVSMENFVQSGFLSERTFGTVHSVVCLDDILTTGSTMQSVKKAVLARFPEAEVYFSAIAH